MSFQVTPFCRPKFKKFAGKNRENEQVPAKRKQFLIIYTTPLDSLMTSQNSSFEQDKKD